MARPVERLAGGAGDLQISRSAYHCCFCALPIEPIIPDPIALLLTTCCDSPAEERTDQEMYCHAACLKARLRPDFPLYAVELAERQALDVKDIEEEPLE